jgi:hypothetical protein
MLSGWALSGEDCAVETLDHGDYNHHAIWAVARWQLCSFPHQNLFQLVLQLLVKMVA